MRRFVSALAVAGTLVIGVGILAATVMTPSVVAAKCSDPPGGPSCN